MLISGIKFGFKGGVLDVNNGLTCILMLITTLASGLELEVVVTGE